MDTSFPLLLILENQEVGFPSFPLHSIFFLSKGAGTFLALWERVDLGAALQITPGGLELMGTMALNGLPYSKPPIFILFPLTPGDGSDFYLLFLLLLVSHLRFEPPKEARMNLFLDMIPINSFLHTVLCM